jgi:hypothetical protein
MVGSSSHYSSSFILTTITDQPIVVIVFHILFFLITGKNNYFESFFGAMMAMLCFYLTPQTKTIVFSFEFVLSVFAVFCAEYLVNIFGFPVAFINIIVYITLFKIDHFYMNVYCIMTLAQVIIKSYLIQDQQQVLAYAGLSTVVALGVVIWKKKRNE